MDAAQAKFLVDTLTGSLENEFKTTVKVLAAVRDDNKNYKPDEKSRSAWQLATHLATADVWFLDSIIQGKFDFDAEAEKKAEAQFKSVNDVVEFYKKTFPAKLAELRGLSGDKLTRTVDFFGMLKMPAAGFLPLMNNHSIHHRGQLAAYLRPMGSKVPAIYGGSADEPMQS
jgi:uncharacterized damage-inducible protein DinB